MHLRVHFCVASPKVISIRVCFRFKKHVATLSCFHVPILLAFVACCESMLIIQELKSSCVSYSGEYLHQSMINCHRVKSKTFINIFKYISTHQDLNLVRFFLFSRFYLCFLLCSQRLNLFNQKYIKSCNILKAVLNLSSL